MRGIPKTWNTKQDILYCLNYWPTQTKHALHQFIDNRMEWLIDHKMITDEIGIVDSTHKINEVADEAGNVTERYQVVWAEDPNAKLFRLGFTVEEVKELVK